MASVKHNRRGPGRTHTLIDMTVVLGGNADWRVKRLWSFLRLGKRGHALNVANRVARLTIIAQHILGCRYSAVCFMSEGHPVLGDRSPRELAETGRGVKEVERLLYAILVERLP